MTRDGLESADCPGEQTLSEPDLRNGGRVFSCPQQKTSALLGNAPSPPLRRNPLDFYIRNETIVLDTIGER